MWLSGECRLPNCCRSPKRLLQAGMMRRERRWQAGRRGQKKIMKNNLAGRNFRGKEIAVESGNTLPEELKS